MGATYKALSLLDLFTLSIALTGCGGDTEAPADVEEPVAEETATDAITYNDLSIKYNEAATLYNEVFTLMNEKGIYGTDPNRTETLDNLNATMVELYSELEAKDSTQEQMDVFYSSLDQIIVGLEMMKAE